MSMYWLFIGVSAVFLYVSVVRTPYYVPVCRVSASYHMLLEGLVIFLYSLGACNWVGHFRYHVQTPFYRNNDLRLAFL